jgi:N-acyl homoserine lactone hydrolase
MTEVSVRLHPLRTGTLTVFPAWFVRSAGVRRARVKAPVVSYAIEHPEAGLVLIDAGLHAESDFGRFNGLVFAGMRRTTTVPEELRARGLEPGAVRTILMTHMHVDHTSGLRLFPDAEVVVDRREWEATSDGAFHGYHRPHFAHVEPRLVDPDGPHDGFDRGHDVFGDGSVVLVRTPGHTHGHCSAVVRTAAGPVLVAGDAIYTMENLVPGRVPVKMEDARAYRRSIEQINAWRAAHPGALVIPGHDEADWAELEPSY